MSKSMNWLEQYPALQVGALYSLHQGASYWHYDPSTGKCNEDIEKDYISEKVNAIFIKPYEGNPSSRVQWGVFLYEDRLIVGAVNHARPIEKERNE